MVSQWGLSLQPASSHLCSGLQVGRLLQQLAMTGSEEGDPRTKSSLGKFDKVRVDPMSCEGLCMESSAKILVNLTVLFIKSYLSVMYKLNILFNYAWFGCRGYSVGSVAFKGRCHQRLLMLTC